MISYRKMAIHWLIDFIFSLSFLFSFNSSIHPFIYSCNSFMTIHPFVSSFFHSFIPFIHSFNYLFLLPSIQSFIYYPSFHSTPLIHSFFHSLTHYSHPPHQPTNSLFHSLSHPSNLTSFILLFPFFSFICSFISFFDLSLRTTFPACFPRNYL